MLARIVIGMTKSGLSSSIRKFLRREKARIRREFLDTAEAEKKITEGDEEYCRTCGERNMCCDCYPPEYRWKIKE